MDTTVLIVLIAAVAVVVVALFGALAMQRRRTGELRESFGSEYDRAVRHADSQTDAEQELIARRKRVQALNIRELNPDARDRYHTRWMETQARFVDEPQAAIDDADNLLGEVMRERGYPTGDFEQNAADISVDHPQFVSSYRKAHGIAVAREAGVEPETEQLRQAMVSYRELFDDLLGTAPAAAASDGARRRTA